MSANTLKLAAPRGFGLAGIQAFRFQELVKPCVDTVSHLVQDAGAFLQCHLAPGAAQGRFRGFDCGVHLVTSGFVNFADHLAVGRVDVVEQLAAGRANILPIDVVLDVFHCC